MKLARYSQTSWHSPADRRQCNHCAGWLIDIAKAELKDRVKGIILEEPRFGAFESSLRIRRHSGIRHG